MTNEAEEGQAIKDGFILDEEPASPFYPRTFVRAGSPDRIVHNEAEAKVASEAGFRMVDPVTAALGAPVTYVKPGAQDRIVRDDAERAMAIAAGFYPAVPQAPVAPKPPVVTSTQPK